MTNSFESYQPPPLDRILSFTEDSRSEILSQKFSRIATRIADILEEDDKLLAICEGKSTLRHTMGCSALFQLNLVYSPDELRGLLISAAEQGCSWAAEKLPASPEELPELGIWADVDDDDGSTTAYVMIKKFHTE
jgi:hypothetical protein